MKALELARPVFAGGAAFLFAEAVADEMPRETDKTFGKAALGAAVTYVIARQFTRPVTAFAFALGTTSALIHFNSQMEKK